MTPADLRALLDAATPGPWRHAPAALVGDDDGWAASVLADDGRTPDAETVVVAVCWAGTWGTESDPDAALIVAAVNTLPALLAVAEAAAVVCDPMVRDAGGDRWWGAHDDLSRALAALEATR